MNKKIILFLILLGILSGCSLRSFHSGSTYESGEMGSPTYFKKGVILSIRDVVIKGTESGVGSAAGAAVGGLAVFVIQIGIECNVRCFLIFSIFKFV